MTWNSERVDTQSIKHSCNKHRSATEFASRETLRSPPPFSTYVLNSAHGGARFEMRRLHNYVVAWHSRAHTHMSDYIDIKTLCTCVSIPYIVATLVARLCCVQRTEIKHNPINLGRIIIYVYARRRRTYLAIYSSSYRNVIQLELFSVTVVDVCCVYDDCIYVNELSMAL